MAVQVDGIKCAYIQGECNCHEDQSGACNCSCGSGCCSTSSGCADACPEGAINQKDRQLIIDEERCTECGVCILVCGHGAITI